MPCFGAHQKQATCEYAKDCELYRADSYTCSHDGGNYCGEWRHRKEKQTLFIHF